MRVMQHFLRRCADYGRGLAVPGIHKLFLRSAIDQPFGISHLESAICHREGHGRRSASRPSPHRPLPHRRAKLRAMGYQMDDGGAAGGGVLGQVE